MFDASDAAVAPDLLNPEVLQVVRAHELRGEIDETRSRTAIQTLLQLPIARYPTGSLLERAWVFRHNLTAYDAVYVALAEALETSLVTADAPLANAARAHARIPVVLLE